MKMLENSEKENWYWYKNGCFDDIVIALHLVKKCHLPLMWLFPLIWHFPLMWHLYWVFNYQQTFSIIFKKKISIWIESFRTEWKKIITNVSILISIFINGKYENPPYKAIKRTKTCSILPTGCGWNYFINFNFKLNKNNPVSVDFNFLFPKKATRYKCKQKQTLWSLVMVIFLSYIHAVREPVQTEVSPNL